MYDPNHVEQAYVPRRDDDRPTYDEQDPVQQEGLLPPDQVDEEARRDGRDHHPQHDEADYPRGLVRGHQEAALARFPFGQKWSCPHEAGASA